MLHRQNRTISGFTLVEVLLTLALVIVVTGISLPVYFQLKPKNDIETTSLIVIESLYRAQTLAMNGEHDDSWGVLVEQGNVTLYAINSSSERVAEYDEGYTVPDSIVFSGLTNIIFKKLTGEPITEGSFIISNANLDVSKTITINKKGLVSF